MKRGSIAWAIPAYKMVGNQPRSHNQVVDMARSNASKTIATQTETQDQLGLVEIDVREVNLLLDGHLAILAVPRLGILNLQMSDCVRPLPYERSRRNSAIPSYKWRVLALSRVERHEGGVAKAAHVNGLLQGALLATLDPATIRG
uniref:Uncharacterized protein n=1 Tax=Pristionchus pacificus TaxID=54126 RepID=A0A2A6C5K5_PRIPA|eukprot:PDM73378.1 hypothetical protein PRIPAC_40734 [Pristionchus pacificus]